MSLVFDQSRFSRPPIEYSENQCLCIYWLDCSTVCSSDYGHQCLPFTQFTTSCYKCLVFYTEASISAKQTVHTRVPAVLLVPLSTAPRCKFDGLQILPGNAEQWASFFVRSQLAARVAQFVRGIRTLVDRNAHCVVVCTVYYV